MTYTRHRIWARARREARKAWNNYVTIRRAYREGKATIQEVALALALSDLAHADLTITAHKLGGYLNQLRQPTLETQNLRGRHLRDPLDRGDL